MSVRVLMVSAYAVNSGDAYEHRLDSLGAALAKAGARTDKLQLNLQSRILGGGGVGQLSALWTRLPWRDWDWLHIGGAIVPAMASLRRPPGGARVIFDAHGLVHAEKAMEHPRGTAKLRIPMLYGISVLAARRADLCVTMSGPMLAHLARWRGTRDGLAIVRNGVDTDLFSPGSTSERSDRPFTVVYAGAFQHWQAVDLLIDAARRIDDPRVRFRFVGFTTADDAVRRTLEATMPPGTELLDRMPRDRLVALLREADLLALPRRFHPATHAALPTKFAEYVALGKPVLVNRVDETAEIVEARQCGFVAEPDPEDMARAIRRAVATPPAALAAMGERGRAFVESELTWAGIGARYLDLLVSRS